MPDVSAALEECCGLYPRTQTTLRPFVRANCAGREIRYTLQVAECVEISIDKTNTVNNQSHNIATGRSHD